MNEFFKKGAVDSFTLVVWIGGDFNEARRAAREYCDRGACLAIEPVSYVYTWGEETGVKVTVLNYARFPTTPEEQWEKAHDVALFLALRLHQKSYSVEGPDRTEYWERTLEEIRDPKEQS